MDTIWWITAGIIAVIGGLIWLEEYVEGKRARERWLKQHGYGEKEWFR